jgi:iron complex outermembrane receptor protein
MGFATQEIRVKMQGADVSLNVTMEETSTELEMYTVNATRANESSGVAHTNISKEEISKNNVGMDLPYLVDQTPSAVVTSDAGTGIGYTGIRIRGWNSHKRC